ncbi:maltose ABC transporter permease MalF [Aquabacterium sp. A7-Y]|uniref:maltose ABC transporter permease MalF n=1 Tax=Aquabacterium sp. A7-Y TaxID=1349605 RepID=UPI00223D022D|nr:maltose ABC transporter permease MalF [Aquabacterium sp. A7-Y]MCW7540935.1 maltose ABC transporter permease MalF [Aquabacterium sp. A7-Y]
MPGCALGEAQGGSQASVVIFIEMNPSSGFKQWAGPAVGAALALAALYVVTIVYAAGEFLLAGAILLVVALAAWIYSSQRLYAYRYLFPGIAAVAIFVVLPILYTVTIGFTNYSTNNLLKFERATAYFLDETYEAEGKTYTFTLLQQGKGYRARLTENDGEQVFLSEALDLEAPATPGNGAKADSKHVEAGPVAADATAPAGEPVQLKELIRLQPALKKLTVDLPDGSQVRMTGLRQFGPVTQLYKPQPDGSLVNQQTGEVIRPNHEVGFYQTDSGQNLSPGFQVNIGLAHFRQIFTDQAFRQPFLRIFGWTVAFAGLTVVFATGLGVLLAVLLSWEALRFKGVYQTLLFLPYAVPGFISILVFKGLFNNNFGEINLILDALFGIKPAWFSDPFLAKVMILTVNTWLGYPYMMVVTMGLIKAIPADLYEASAVAGAGPLTNFFRITMPLVLKPLTPLLIAAFAFNFNNFVLISLLTNGRPDFLDTQVPAGTTDILVSYTYRIAFEDSGQNFGLAAAISTVVFAMVALLSWVNLRATRITKEEAR